MTSVGMSTFRPLRLTPDGKQQNETLDRLSLILVNRSSIWRIVIGHKYGHRPDRGAVRPGQQRLD